MIAERIAWEFESAPIRQQLQIRARRGTTKIHKFEKAVLERQPAEDELVDDVMHALRDLGTCRPIGMGMGNIPITAIWQWCDRRGGSPEYAETMTHLIRIADDTYLAEYAKKAAKP